MLRRISCSNVTAATAARITPSRCFHNGALLDCRSPVAHGRTWPAVAVAPSALSVPRRDGSSVTQRKPSRKRKAATALKGAVKKAKAMLNPLHSHGAGPAAADGGADGMDEDLTPDDEGELDDDKFSSLLSHRTSADAAEVEEDGDVVAEPDAAPAADEEEDPSPGPPSAVYPADDIADSKYIADALPELAAEYSAAGRVNEVPVEEVKMDSAAVASWRCPRCEGVWRSAVFVRCTLKNNCPTCTAARHPSVAVSRPDLVALWDASRNDPFVCPQECPADSSKTVHWLCPTCTQSFPARVKDRVTDKTLCRTCALMHLQSADVLAQEESALLQEWHPIKNGDLRLDQVQPTDTKTKIWWLCSHCGHDWEATLSSRLSRSRRSRGRACPVCRDGVHSQL